MCYFDDNDYHCKYYHHSKILHHKTRVIPDRGRVPHLASVHKEPDDV
jgi:hypothetical protein